MEEKLLLNVKECVDFVGIGENALRNLARKYEDMPKIKIGTKLYFIKSELNNWFVSHSGETLENDD